MHGRQSYFNYILPVAGNFLQKASRLHVVHLCPKVSYEKNAK